MELAIVIAVAAIALVFGYTNGFHDAANAIATSVSTRALTPRVALLLAAVMNFIGAFLGQKVAETVAEVIQFDQVILSGTASTSVTVHALIIVMAGLLGAIGWNLLTWYFGIPSSSSHALIGGLGGAALAGGVAVNWDTVLNKVVIPMVLSPLFAFAAGFGVMVLIMWVFRRIHPAKANRNFRILQTLSAAAMALGHGLQDAQKTMGVILLALVAGGYVGANARADAPGWVSYTLGDSVLPVWVIVASAAAISLGTYAGGWRITRTLGRRILHLDPPRGFAAESVAAGVLYTTAFAFSAPISTTHTITSAVVGVGATKRFSAIRWGVAKSIVTAWVLTFPAAAAMAAVCYWIAHFLLEVL